MGKHLSKKRRAFLLSSFTVSTMRVHPFCARMSGRVSKGHARQTRGWAADSRTRRRRHAPVAHLGSTMFGTLQETQADACTLDCLVHAQAVQKAAGSYLPAHKHGLDAHIDHAHDSRGTLFASSSASTALAIHASAQERPPE